MPPAVSRMHPSHMSNPFATLPPSGLGQGSHYASQSQHLPSNFGALNGGISPFAPGSTYGGTAFSSAATNTATPGMFVGGGQGLASVAAQQGFARGAAMQEHSQAQLDAASMQTGGLKSGPNARIREVWRGNLEQEFAALRQLVIKYPYVSMVSVPESFRRGGRAEKRDHAGNVVGFSNPYRAWPTLAPPNSYDPPSPTSLQPTDYKYKDAEFPGIVARPIGNFAGSKAEYHYQTLRCNVDLLKPIQLGITLWTADGELPPAELDPNSLSTNSRGLNGLSKPYPAGSLMPCPCTWVFNFSFDLGKDMYSTSSINLLRESGVDFTRHSQHGIPPEQFGSLLTTSGLTFNTDVNWLSFHSGYDFGYLLKLLTAAPLPAKPEQFFELVATFFPKLWDIKFLLRHAQRLRNQHPTKLGQNAVALLDNLGQKSGLADLATELDCQRIGVAHTGGSDAWLTGSVFFAMMSKIFSNPSSNQSLSAELDNLSDQIYGLHGVGPPASQQYRDEFLMAQGTPQGVNGTSTLTGAATGFTPSANPSTPTSSHAGISGQTPQQHGFGPALNAGAGAFQGGFNYGK